MTVIEDLDRSERREPCRQVVVKAKVLPRSACRVGTVIVISCMLGCKNPDATIRSTYHNAAATPRSGLRADVIGCWEVAGDASKVTTLISGRGPIRVRLDTSITLRDGAGRRAVQRLDSLGNPVLQDTEGFAPMDWWMADSLGDRIWVSFSNGLYGANWVFDVPRSAIGVYAMRGHSQGFGDEWPPRPFPVREVTVERMRCRSDEDAAKPQ